MSSNRIIKYLVSLILHLGFCHAMLATNFIVATLPDFQSSVANALPGDTVIVRNGNYSWGQISLSNNNGNVSSAWIVIKAQMFDSVVFTGNTYLQFSGTHLLVTGFRFASGNAGTNGVIQFRNSSGLAANYCRINNIVIDNYNSDSSANADPANPGVGIDNKWVSIYGTNNRVDHCTFINKFNAGATLVVWYEVVVYPQQASSTYNRIDSNYFNGRGYKNGNGGESIRVGTSTVSRSNGFNVIEYNLFENMVQLEPEVISNKTCFNTYRYNTIKNCTGGLTLRHGRYCSVYGNFIIVDNPTVSNAYGIRIIDKGHKVFNNYIEGVNGNSGSLTSLRCPIILYNGLYSVNDTTNPAHSSGYWPADSSIVAFNSLVNCKGGAGIVIAHTDQGTLTYQPLGLVLANNVIKMATGQAAYKDPSSSTATYFSEGNIYNAPSGIGNIAATGFTSGTLNFSVRQNGILIPPTLLQDAAVNTSTYSSMLNQLDAQGQTRSSVYEVGADEINGTGPIISYPLNNTLVGAGTPFSSPVPLHLIDFSGYMNSNTIFLTWLVENEIDFKQYELEYSTDGVIFYPLGTVSAKNQSLYKYQSAHIPKQKEFCRLKLVDNNGGFVYSKTIVLYANAKSTVRIFPNPASEYVIIEWKGIAGQKIQCNLFDQSGKLINKLDMVNYPSKISIKGLTKGLYHFQIKQPNEEAVFYPFMIE